MSGPWTEGVRREVLPNGLTLLVQSMPGATAVASFCHVRAGFFDEPDQLAGVSHVLEHMLFKGTPTRGVGELAREMKAVGGYLNAGTGYDHTVYYAVLPPEALPVALDLQADALRRSLIDPGELKRELIVIIEEAKRKLDNPAAVTGETLYAELFDVHRIRRWRIGTEAQLSAMSHADVVGYYRSRYVPSRVVVAVAGAVVVEAALDAAREACTGWAPAAPTLDHSPAEPPRRDIRARTLRGDVRQAELAVGWRSVPALHQDAAPLDVAAMVLGSGRASWLYRALRLPGQVTSVGTAHFTPTEVGTFSVSADLDPKELAPALYGIGDCLTRLREAGPSAADLARARVLLEARWARRLQTAEGRAGALAAAEALGGIALLDEEYRRVLAVDVESVRRIAQEYLLPDSVAAVAYLPGGARQELDRELLGLALQPRPGGSQPPVEEFRPSMVRRRPVEGRRVGEVWHVALAGTDLLLWHKPGVELVSLGIYRHRTLRESVANAGIGALGVRSAVRGAGELRSDQLALAFERLGGSVSSLVSADWFGFGTSVLAAHAAEAASLLAMVLRTPRLDDAEVARERVTLAEEAMQQADDMVRYPIQLALRRAFGAQGYGLPIYGLPASIPELGTGLLREWHAGELARGRTLLVAVGPRPVEALAEQLAGLFDDEPPRAGAEPPPPVSWVAGPGGPAVEQREKRQTALALLYPGPARTAATRFAAEVWATVASGLGGRLFTALREERSLAYSLFASSWQRAAAGAVLLYIATSPEREQEARDALLLELARFRREPPSDDEVQRAIGYLTGQLTVSRQTAGALAAELADAWLVGTGLDELIDPARGYRAVTPAAILQLAEQCLEPSLAVEGVIRGR